MAPVGDSVSCGGVDVQAKLPKSMVAVSRQSIDFFRNSLMIIPPDKSDSLFIVFVIYLVIADVNGVTKI